MNLTVRKLLLFLSIALYISAKEIEITVAYHTVGWIPLLLKILRFVSYISILYISIWMTDYDRQSILRYIIIMLLLMLVSYKAGSGTIIFGFLFIFAAKDIPIETTIKYVLIIQASIAVIAVTACLLGVLPDWVYSMGARVRHSLGYGYPNSLPTLYFYCVLAFCLLLKKRFNFLLFILLTAGNYLIFLYTNTRTSFLLSQAALLAFLALKYYRKELCETEMTRLLYVHSVYLIAVFSICACLLYSPSNQLLVMADSMISNRLKLGHDALLANRITLFGQYIQWYGFGGVGYTTLSLTGEYNYVDCSYVKILLDNGIVMLLIAVAGYTYAAAKALKAGNRYFCAALLFANLFSIIEPRYIEMGFNPFVWSLSVLVSDRLLEKDEVQL